jgi:hypothetical protein
MQQAPDYGDLPAGSPAHGRTAATAAVRKAESRTAREWARVEVTAGQDNTCVRRHQRHESHDRSERSGHGVFPTPKSVNRDPGGGHRSHSQGLRRSVGSTSRTSGPASCPRSGSPRRPSTPIPSWPTTSERPHRDNAVPTPAALTDIEQRIGSCGFAPITENLNLVSVRHLRARHYKTIDRNQPFASFTFVSTEPEAGLRNSAKRNGSGSSKTRRSRVVAATSRETPFRA